MADIAGTMKAALLLRWPDGEPFEIATIELPIRTESVGDGKVNLSVDTRVFERMGKALAAALKEELDPALAVMAAQRRLVEAQERLARGA